MKTPREMMTEALAHVLSVYGDIPATRTNVDVDPTGNYPVRIWPDNPIQTCIMVRVYGDLRVGRCVQLTDPSRKPGDREHSANIRKGNKLGPVKSW